MTAGGYVGDHPPTDEVGLLEFVRTLPASNVYDVISREEPLTDVLIYKYPASLRHHYEKLKRFPEGYLILGDAVASFNPIYGQGMTSSAMQTYALRNTLRDRSSLDGLWKPFFKQAARVVDMPWQLAVGEDFRYPETEGKKPPFMDLLNAYVEKVHRATHRDPVVYVNALRHTPVGGMVTVWIGAHGDSAVQLSVENTGPCIPVEHLPRLFDRFYRADSVRHRTTEGSGLGLAITRSILSAHGGEIAVSSENGVTRFTLLLPSSGKPRLLAKP